MSHILISMLLFLSVHDNLQQLSVILLTSSSSRRRNENMIYQSQYLWGDRCLTKAIVLPDLKITCIVNIKIEMSGLAKPVGIKNLWWGWKITLAICQSIQLLWWNNVQSHRCQPEPAYNHTPCLLPPPSHTMLNRKC